MKQITRGKKKKIKRERDATGGGGDRALSGTVI